MLSNDTQTAIATLKSAVEMEPESAWSRAYLVSVLVDCDRMDEARQMARTILSLERGFSVAQWHGARFRNPDIRTQVIENLQLAGLPG